MIDEWYSLTYENGRRASACQLSGSMEVLEELAAELSVTRARPIMIRRGRKIGFRSRYRTLSGFAHGERVY